MKKNKLIGVWCMIVICTFIVPVYIKGCVSNDSFSFNYILNGLNTKKTNYSDINFYEKNDPYYTELGYTEYEKTIIVEDDGTIMMQYLVSEDSDIYTVSDNDAIRKIVSE
jgi:hypothetical protein